MLSVSPPPESTDILVISYVLINYVHLSGPHLSLFVPLQNLSSVPPFPFSQGFESISISGFYIFPLLVAKMKKITSMVVIHRRLYIFL